MPRVEIEPEILEGSRAFADAQATFDRVADYKLGETYEVGWHATAIHPERGAFAIVLADGPLSDLVGDHLRLWHNHRSVNVYVLNRSEDLDVPLSLTRRAFIALDLLHFDSITCEIEVLL